MSVEQNKSIALRWNEEALSQHKPELIDELIHPNYVNDHDVRGLAAAKEAFTGMANNPNLRIKVEDLIGEGDKVVMRWSGSDGVNKYRGITIYRIEDNKIREDWFCSEAIVE